jgi:uncharacterized protein (DUF362 family)
MPSSPIPVSLIRCERYDDAELLSCVDRAFGLCGYAPARGSHILVKPNLLRADRLTCTDAGIVRAVCVWLLERGVRVKVGDSPGFGTAAHVSRSIGLTKALADSGGGGLAVQALGRPVLRRIPGLGMLPVSRDALEADGILSLPRVKAHTMMGITCAVKNLYGCVPGLHKAVAHARYGDKGRDGLDMARCIAELTRLLPPQAALADGVTAMHVSGPSGGKPYPLHLVAASASCVALDTALYGLLGLTPEQLPLWRALLETGTRGARPEHVELCGDSPESFATRDFVIPHMLMTHSFNPLALLRSLYRRIRASLLQP